MSKKQNNPSTDDKTKVITESMIRLNRRWNYVTRSRPNAIAIVHPETRTVLFPGKEKNEVEEKLKEAEGEKQQPAENVELPMQSNNLPGGNRKFTNLKVMEQKSQIFVFSSAYQRMNPYLAPGVIYANHITYYDLPFHRDLK